MVEGGGSRDFAKLKLWAYRDPDGFGALIDVLVDATVEYLDRQVGAGAQVVKLFGSWAGAAPETQFERWVVRPTAEIVRRLRERSEEHTSELQSLMRISYAVFCLKKKT